MIIQEYPHHINRQKNGLKTDHVTNLNCSVVKRDAHDVREYKAPFGTDNVTLHVKVFVATAGFETSGQRQLLLGCPEADANLTHSSYLYSIMKLIHPAPVFMANNFHNILIKLMHKSFISL